MSALQRLFRRGGGADPMRASTAEVTTRLLETNRKFEAFLREKIEKLESQNSAWETRRSSKPKADDKERKDEVGSKKASEKPDGDDWGREKAEAGPPPLPKEPAVEESGGSPAGDDWGRGKVAGPSPVPEETRVEEPVEPPPLPAPAAGSKAPGGSVLIAPHLSEGPAGTEVAGPSPVPEETRVEEPVEPPPLPAPAAGSKAPGGPVLAAPHKGVNRAMETPHSSADRTETEVAPPEEAAEESEEMEKAAPDSEGSEEEVIEWKAALTSVGEKGEYV